MLFYPDSDTLAGMLRVEAWREIPWLVHGFSTRTAGDFSRAEVRKRSLASTALGGLSWRAAGQIHSSRLWVEGADVEADDGVAPRSGQPAEADGLLTRRAGLLLSVRTADCVPLLLLDRKRRAVAAVHAGWRGTVKQIARRSVERMQSEFASKPADLEAAIGPAIGACCYEVGEDVAAQFDRRAVSARSGRPRLDLSLANRLQLARAGIPTTQIRCADLCTHCLGEQFYSYRRDGSQAGRMVAVIGIRPESCSS